MSYASTVIENQYKLYALGEQEGYRKTIQNVNNGKVISDYDLSSLTSGHATEQAYVANRVYYKDFIFNKSVASPYDVYFNVTGLYAERTVIVVKPLEEGATIVTSDDQNLSMVKDKDVIIAYNYTNNGDEEFDENNATFGKISSKAVISIDDSVKGYVCSNFCGSDDIYVSGSKVRTDRAPIQGRPAWHQVPEECQGCDYLVFPNSAFTRGEQSIHFYVSGSVRVYVFCAATLTFSDTWETLADGFARNRYQNYINPLTMAYMVNKGYILESDVLTENSNYRCRRWDAVYKMLEDCGTKQGFTINPARLAKTGFTENLADFRYQDYLNAWVPTDCDGDYVTKCVSTSEASKEEVYDDLFGSKEDWSYFNYKGRNTDIIQKLRFNDTRNGINFQYMFGDCSKLTSIPMFDTSKGTDFQNMFDKCSVLTSVPTFDTHNGTRFDRMFYFCNDLTTVPELDTSKGTSFAAMFYNCKSLTTIPTLNTSNGTSFENMFFGCTELVSIPMLDLHGATSFYQTFRGCAALTTIPKLDTSNVTNLFSTFTDCTALTLIPEIDTSKATDISGMFKNCTSLETIQELNLSSVEFATNAFAGCSSLVNLNIVGTINMTGITFVDCTLLSHDSLLSILKALATKTSGTWKLTIGSTNLAKLSDEEKAIAINKGWTVN